MLSTTRRRSIALAVIALLGGATAGADVIHLRGGGALHGVLETDPSRDGYVRIWTATSSIPIAMKKERVDSVEPADTPVREYLARRAAAPATADGQVELAQWCEQAGLTGPAQAHYEEALKLDPQNAPANEKLGRVFWDGQYRSHDEIRESQGLVKAHGRWMNPEEKARADQKTQESATQRSWSRRIAQLVEEYNGGDPRKRAEAAQALQQIREPEAIVPLVNTLGHQEPALRTLLADLLGAIDDPKAALGLAHRALAEDDGPIRSYTLGPLSRRKSPEVIAALMKGLDDKRPPVVGRAAAALAALGAEQAVPKLVPKLVSTQKRVQTVMMPAQDGGGVGGGMGMNVGFSQQQGNLGFAPGGLANSSVRNSSSGSFGVPPNGSAFMGTGYSYPAITGVATAPGVVAFGVAAAPVVSGIGFGTGGGGIGPAGGAGGNLVPTPVIVPYRHQNGEVLAALQQLTGQDFGFNVDAWKRWLMTDYQPPAPAQPGRRVPQP